MKKTFFLIVSVLLLLSVVAFSKKTKEKEGTKQVNTINIVCSPDLYDLTNQWSEKYKALNPGIKINVEKLSTEEMTEALNQDGDLGFISDQYYHKFADKSMWKVVVGREIIVPVININNPFLDQILEQGISPDQLKNIFKSPGQQNWSLMFDNGQDVPLNFYLTPDKTNKSMVADFLGLIPSKINGKEIQSNQDVIHAVQSDPFGIAFCNLTDIVSAGSHSLVENIRLLPIDKNGNRQIDYFEKIYDNVNEFTRGVWIGKYPKSLISNIYSVSIGLPGNEAETSFLTWILSDGQKLLDANGVSELVINERNSKIDKLSELELFKASNENSYAAQRIVLLILVLVVAGSLILSLSIRLKKKQLKEHQNNPSGIFSTIDENSLDIPNGLYYDKSHTWVFMEKDGIVKVGIDDFLQHVSGSFTRIIMKNPGENVKKSEAILSLVQDGKHLNIYAPVSGTIKEINENLVTDPSVINSSPYADGWIYEIEPSNWLREIQFLRMAGRYKEWLSTEFTRLKDFLAGSTNGKSEEYTRLVFQDGGVLKDHVLHDFGPEIWEDFQKNFIDTSELK